MNRLLHVASLLAIVLSFCGLPGCNETPAAPGPPRIIAGESRDLVSEVVSSSGGLVYADLPGDSLDGLEIDVPADAYDDGRTFRVSASPITSHEFGPDFNPLTPLIKIENGGGYSEEPMRVTIPCTIPDGHFAMAFLYDRATGQIEGVPTVAMDDGSITILTYNFEFSTVASAAKPSVLNGGAVVVGSSEVVISSIPEAKLDDPYDSGFLPGVDDWQIPNYGSHLYLGHCSGMSATMMWYYNQRRQRWGDQPLNGRLDNDGTRTTPKIWADDDAGYRFTGMATVDLPWMTRFQQLLIDFEKLSPKITFNLFAYAIRITKQPQFVWIIDERGAKDGSHAMVIYKVEGGKIFIADPNYSGKTDRMTEFSFGQFLPYYTGPNAQNVGGKYTKFYYLAYSSIIDTKVFNSQWGRVIEGSIGEERYPRYTISARDENGNMFPLTDGFVTKTGILDVDIRNSDIPLKIVAVYDKNENSVPYSNKIVRLQFGEHLLGFHVTDTSGSWVGFEWIRVEAKEDATVPIDPVPSESGSDCSAFFTIDGTGQLVTETYYDKYVNNMFSFKGYFPGGHARFMITGFSGPGTYTLYNSGNYEGSYLLMLNGLSWFGDGTMTITRYDVEKVAGTFTFESKNGSGQTVKKIVGEFQCNR